MSNILVNGIRIWYEERGKGPAILWAHGLGGTLHEWDETIAFFKKNYRVIAYDARGHGCSEVPDSPTAYSQDIMVEDLRGLMDALDIPQAIVGGHSMGANVALNFALQYPSRKASLKQMLKAKAINSLGFEISSNQPQSAWKKETCSTKS